MIGWKNYVKKPVMVKAMRYTGKDSAAEIIRFTTGIREEKVVGSQGELNPCLIIQAYDSEVQCNLGDWVVIDQNGVPYPCKNSIFEQTYDPVGETAEIPQ